MRVFLSKLFRNSGSKQNDDSVCHSGFSLSFPQGPASQQGGWESLRRVNSVGDLDPRVKPEDDKRKDSGQAAPNTANARMTSVEESGHHMEGTGQASQNDLHVASRCGERDPSACHFMKSVGMTISKAATKRNASFLVPLFLFGLTLIALPHSAFAQGAPTGLAAFSASNWSKWILDRISEFFWALSYNMLDLGYQFVVAGANASFELIGNSAVAKMWEQTRDATLGLFGAVLLAIAFMNMMKIKVEEWGYQRLIPKFLLVAFFVFFSKFICASIINLSHSLTLALSLRNLEVFDSSITEMGKTIGEGMVPSIQLSLGVFIVCFLTMVVFLLLAAILYIRGLLLGMLIVVSPLAFSMIALPVTQSIFKKFWDMFIKWAFFLPVCFFILSIGLGFTVTDPSKDKSTPVTNVIANMNAESRDDAVKFANNFDSFLYAIVAIPLAVFIPLGFLGAVGGAFQKAMKKGVRKGMASIPGVQTTKGFLADRGKKRAARKQERFGNLMRKSFGNLPGGGFITGESAVDKIANKNKLTKDFGSFGFSKEQKQAYVQGNLDRSTLDSDKQRLLKDFEKRGGNKENVIDNLVEKGELNTTTAKHAENYLKSKGDWEGALKTSGLHHMRNGGKFDMSTLGSDQLKKMDPNDIKAGHFGTPSVGYGKWAANNKALTPTRQQAIAEGLTAGGHHAEAQHIHDHLNPPTPANTGGGGTGPSGSNNQNGGGI